MKAYGLPRRADIANPDCADIREFGLKSSAGRNRGKGGDIKNSFHSSAAKKATRRNFKKSERHASKDALRKGDF